MAVRLLNYRRRTSFPRYALPIAASRPRADLMTPPRVLIIGLEMGDETLILDWSAAGKLPVLRQLLDGGAWGELESTASHLSGSAWPTVYTGVLPGQHGVYAYLQPLPGRQGWVPFFAELYGAPSFWHTLDQAGYRCIVFDAPYTYPEPGFGGKQIFDWATWERFAGRRSMPRSLIYRLRMFNGPYPLRLDAAEAGLTQRDPNEMKRRLVRAARAKARAATWLIRKSEFDLFMVVFSETNPAGRYLWRSDGSPGQPDLFEVYKEVDRGIGALLREIADEDLVVVVSADGVGRNVHGWHLLPEALRRLEYLADASGRAGTAGIDWSKTRAFCLPTDREGYIRINLEGREPSGTVSPAEYRSVCRDIAAALREMTNPATGGPAVRDVIESRDAFSGLRQLHLPDLVVIWSDDGPIEGLESARVGSIREVSPDSRPGTRGPPGFLLARGQGVEPGWAFRGHIRDVAPTILTLFGKTPPAYMDGHSWVTTTEKGPVWA